MPTARFKKSNVPGMVGAIQALLGFSYALRKLDSGSAACRRADDLADTTENREILGWSLAGGAVVAAGATVLVWWLWETDIPVDVAYGPGNRDMSVRWSHEF